MIFNIAHKTFLLSLFGALQKCAIGIILFVIITASNADDEAKSNPSDSFAARSSTLTASASEHTSTVNDVGKQQNKRLDYVGE